MEEISLNDIVYVFSLDHSVVDIQEIFIIHDYLIKKHNIKCF